MSAGDRVETAFVPTARHWLVAIIGFVLLLAGGLYRSHQVLFGAARETAEQQLQAVAALKSQEIQRWIEDRLIFLSQPPGSVMSQHFARLLQQPGDARAAAGLRQRFRYLQQTIPEISAIGLHDLAGRSYLADPADDHLRDDTLHQEAVQALLESRRPRLVDFHRKAGREGEVVLDLLVPLFAEGETGRLIGYALFEIDPARVLYPMVSQWPVPSATGESLLVRRDGDEVLFLSPLGRQAGAPLKLRLPLDTPGLISGMALHGVGEVLAGRDYRGLAVLGVVLPVGQTDWLLVAKMDDSEIYREARRNFAWLTAAGVVLMAVLLLLGRVFSAALQAREQEARFRLLAESGSDVVWLYELASRRFAYVSPSVQAMRGITVEEALQQTMADLLTPECHQHLDGELERWIAAVDTGQEAAASRHYELVQPRKDGSLIQTEAVMTLITDAQGRVTHIQGISRDITERKRAEAELRKFLLSAEQSPVSIVITNLAAEIEYVNEAFVRTAGYSREEVLGQNPRILQSGRTPRSSYEEMWRCLSRGEGWRGELFNRRKDGSEYLEDASINPIRQPDGSITHYLAVKEDITERRATEAALAESEDKFRTIYDTIGDAIFVHDVASGSILDVNGGACRMYGYSREELLSLDVQGITADDPAFPPQAARDYMRRVQEEGPQSFEWMARGSSGRQFWVLVNLQIFRLSGGQRVLAVVRDIDGRKRAEQELQQALAEAKALNQRLAEAQSQLLQSEKMASIGQLAAGVAHEMNNPIGFVYSNLGTLDHYLREIFAIIAAYEAADSGPCRDCRQLESARQLKQEKDFDFLRSDIVQLLAESRDGLERVAKIARDLKDFSRAGEAESQWADLHQGLDSTLNIVWNELKYKCTVHKEYGELPLVWCEPSQINQVFMNLLVNAAQAIPKKGDIWLRTGRRGDEVFVAVSDSGCGIAPEYLHRLFEPFFTTKPVGKGTGLGLSLAYSIVQKHQGRLEVESEPGRGSTFTVWLPIEARPRPEEGAEAASAPR